MRASVENLREGLKVFGPVAAVYLRRSWRRGPKIVRNPQVDGAGATSIRFYIRPLCVTYLHGLGGICYEPPPRMRSPHLCNLVTLVRCAILEQNLMQGLCQVWPFSVLSVMADNTVKLQGVQIFIM